MNPATFQPLALDAVPWDAGLTWDDYVPRMESNRERVQTLYESAAVAEADVLFFQEAVRVAGGALTVTAMTEDWCGDAVAVLPLLARLVDAVSGMRLRLYLQSESPLLNAHYAADGTAVIPVLSFFDAGGQEVARWAERPVAANAARATYLAAYPHLDALRAAGTPEAWAELTTLFDGWIDEMMRLYPAGLWEATLEEWKAILSPRRPGR